MPEKCCRTCWFYDAGSCDNSTFTVDEFPLWRFEEDGALRLAVEELVGRENAETAIEQIASAIENHNFRWDSRPQIDDPGRFYCSEWR